MKNYIQLIFFLAFSLTAFLSNAQTTTVRGTVVGEANEALAGATILVQGTSDGTITELDGSFLLISAKKLPFVIEVSFIGYKTKVIQVGENPTPLKVKLEEGIFTEEIIVSANKRPQKILNAPASVSVLNSNLISVSADLDPTRSLGNLPGVQLQQQSASRVNIEMRNNSQPFLTSVLPLMDNRMLRSPGMGYFSSTGSGISSLDLDRIEVVRGPGSALYGPNVASGVVHFISKNPIDNPGSAIELTNGNMNTFGVAARHAVRVSDKFGFKINVQYRRGDEFTLDINDSADSAQIAKLKPTVSLPAITDSVVNSALPATEVYSEQDLDPDGNGNPMAEDWENFSINGTFEYRPDNLTDIYLSGGYNDMREVFYNTQGEGLMQTQEYWVQLRGTRDLQKYGTIFGQFNYMDNNGGTDENPTWLYQTGLANILGRSQVEGQAQWNINTPSFLNAHFTLGLDYRLGKSNTNNQTFGRNEFSDDFRVFGGYAQAEFELIKDKLDLVFAGRLDDFNFMDEAFFTPRIAAVFQPFKGHSLRLSYNKAGSTMYTTGLFLDFPVASPAPGLFDVWALGVINRRHTFSDDPMIDLTVPGFPDVPYGTPGLPLAIPYGAVTPTVIGALTGNVPQDVIDFLGSYQPANVTGTFVPYNLFTREPMTEFTDQDEVALRVTKAYEFGYRGFFTDKLSVTVDLYYNQVSGFYRFSVLAPTINLVGADIGTDLGADVGASLEAHLLDLGYSTQDAANLATVINGAYTNAGTAVQDQISPLFPIFGAVESENVPSVGGVHVPAGNRTFLNEVIDYWGSDINVTYYINEDFSVFANYSFLSQNLWVPGEADDDGLDFRFGLNAPANRYRIGANYTPEKGFRGSVSFQHDDSFFAEQGQFSGDTDVKNLVDMMIGYRFEGTGLTVGATVNNLFNNQYRVFPNFPRIGRRALLKLTYEFQKKEN